MIERRGRRPFDYKLDDRSMEEGRVRERVSGGSKGKEGQDDV